MTNNTDSSVGKENNLAVKIASAGIANSRTRLDIINGLNSILSVAVCSAAPIQINPNGKLAAASNLSNWSVPKGNPMGNRLSNIPITHEIINGFLIIGKMSCLMEIFAPDVSDNTAITLQLGTNIAIRTAAIAIPSVPNKSATIANPKYVLNRVIP